MRTTPKPIPEDLNVRLEVPLPLRHNAPYRGLEADALQSRGLGADTDRRTGYALRRKYSFERSSGAVAI